MWNELSMEWKTVFTEAWISFKKGSIPIGAAIFDEKGRLLVKDYNRRAESDILNRHISHAEANALRDLDTSAYNPKTVVLYTTMEPCPMCMGTAVMSNIRHLRYAAHDPYCGCAHLKDDEPYIKNHNLDYTHIGGDVEFVQIVVQSYHELKCIANGCDGYVLSKFAEYNPKAVQVAEELYQDFVLDKLAQDDVDYSSVYDMILKKI